MVGVVISFTNLVAVFCSKRDEMNLLAAWVLLLVGCVGKIIPSQHKQESIWPLAWDANSEKYRDYVSLLPRKM